MAARKAPQATLREMQNSLSKSDSEGTYYPQLFCPILGLALAPPSALDKPSLALNSL